MSIVALLSSGARIALPLLLAALGILLSSKAGIIYIAMEGNMMFAAFFGVYAAYVSGSCYIGEIAAILSGIIFALVFGLVVINGRGNQVVCGVGFNFFVSGITSVMLGSLFGSKNVTPKVQRLPVLKLPLVGKLSINIVIGLIMLLLLWLMLRNTSLGLRIRSVGENPQAADSLGVKVYRYQYIALILVGVFAGLSGAELTLGQMGYFSRGITASRGYMAFAITVLGAYNPPLILVAALFIGIADAFQIRAQSYFNIPGQFFIILPYVMTILALVVGKHFKGPAHEGEPYIRE